MSEPGSAEDLEVDYAPWAFWQRASPARRSEQQERCERLRAAGFDIGERCVVSPLAAVHPDRLELGDRSTVAAHAHLSGDLSFGPDCTVNVFTVVRGRVRAGRAVRIGSHTSVLGFNHTFADLDQEIFRQPLQSRGIEIGDDVWIGSAVVVLDGVRIGSHSVVGAGSVVTRDVPAWSVVVGNPARVVRDRRAGRSDPAGPPVELEQLAQALGEQARAEMPLILRAAFDPAGEGAYRDCPDRPPTVRAHCDAVELADLLLGRPPDQLLPAEHVARLADRQDAACGLVPELGSALAARPGPEPALPVPGEAYHVLSVGYALDLLGAAFAHPVQAITGLSAADLVLALDRLPWGNDAWAAGAMVDAVGTAWTWAALAGQEPAGACGEALVGWLLTRRDPATGLWGRASDVRGRGPVNGTYRAVRGTLAQWGTPVAGQEQLLAAVLAHDDLLRRALDGTGAADLRPVTACDGLDVLFLMHWACSARPDLDRTAVRRAAERWLRLIAGRWQPGRGLAFEPDRPVSLQGTEMWLATAWYAADLLGVSPALGYRPRGVHRPGPAARHDGWGRLRRVESRSTTSPGTSSTSGRS